ncbi:MAG: DUF4124 domain-containing protein [Lysobacterales bacterium]|jgi:hypothetical protein
MSESRRWMVAMLIAGIISLSVTSLAADTYRWKDKDGKPHYGAAVPAEYADQPYDILNDAGLVIEHVEDTSLPLEVIAEKKIKEEESPLIAEEKRQTQFDRLLVVRYASEEEILKALELEIGQLGYDMNVITQSSNMTNAALREQISQAADRQRAGQIVSAAQQKEIDQLYARQIRDNKRRLNMSKREDRIRARYEAELERYRYLTSDAKDIDQEPTDQG